MRPLPLPLPPPPYHPNQYSKIAKADDSLARSHRSAAAPAMGKSEEKKVAPAASTHGGKPSASDGGAMPAGFPRASR